MENAKLEIIRFSSIDVIATSIFSKKSLSGICDGTSGNAKFNETALSGTGNKVFVNGTWDAMATEKVLSAHDEETQYSKFIGTYELTDSNTLLTNANGMFKNVVQGFINANAGSEYYHWISN